MNGQEIKELCQWLKETKGITKIGVEELADYYPEFEAYKSGLGDFNKVEDIDIGV